MFELILAKRFENHPGHGKIRRGKYFLEEEHDGREINRFSDLTTSLHPGQKIDMSVLFGEYSGSSNNCPRCKTKIAAPACTGVQW